jgi:hypothetical protein
MAIFGGEVGVEVEETLVLLSDVDGMPAGKEGRVIPSSGRHAVDRVPLELERLELVLARSWEVLPEHKWRRLRKRGIE